MTSTEHSVEIVSLVDLRDPRSRHADLAGMRAAQLAHLMASGIRVPEGFVITTTSCDRILAATELPSDLWAEICTHLDPLGDGPWAVRSSGVAEDQAGAS